MWSLTYGFLGGVIAWIVTTIIVQPLLRFIQLRNEAAFVLAQYDHRAWIGNPDAKSPDDEWRTKRREAYDATGTALIAFAASNVFVARAAPQDTRPLSLLSSQRWRKFENARRGIPWDAIQ